MTEIEKLLKERGGMVAVGSRTLLYWDDLVFPGGFCVYDHSLKEIVYEGQYIEEALMILYDQPSKVEAAS